jgi:multidrug resistance efflux pump
MPSVALCIEWRQKRKSNRRAPGYLLSLLPRVVWMSEDITSAAGITPSARVPRPESVAVQFIGFDDAPARATGPAPFAAWHEPAIGENPRVLGSPWVVSTINNIADLYARNLRRLSFWKLGLTLGCFAAASYFLGPALFFTYSERAITNAPMVTLRPPIPGNVDTIVPRIGQEIDQDSLIATVKNPVWDPAPVLEIDQRLRGARARVEAATSEMTGLKQLRAQLLKDYDTWRGSMTRTADLQIDEAQQHLQAAQARLDAAKTNLDRYAELATLALVSWQRFTDIKRDYAVALRDQSAAMAALQQANQQRETIKSGITLGPSDEPPSLQRMHEIDIHLATESAALAAAQGDVATLQTQREEVLRQRDRETQADLRSPVRGVVWRIYARPGETVSSHSEVASVLDCDRLGITAIFNQRHVSDVVPDRRVSVKLIGISTRLWGRIARVNGYYRADDREAEAIALRPDDDASVIVWVTLDEPLAECWVGLKATVRLE